MSTPVKTLLVQFKQEIPAAAIPLFRGAVSAAVEKTAEKDQNKAALLALFHNHEADGLRYSYPLIQYKRLNGCATMVCVGEGTEAIGAFFAGCDFDLVLGTQRVHLEVAQIKPSKTLMQVWDEKFDYTLRKWLPLNQDNYLKYKQLEGLAEQCAMLEKLLVGNILSFAKGVGVTIEKDIVVKIKNIENDRLYTHKGIKKMGMDVAFSCNVTLPDYIGLGQGVSVGFGGIWGKRK